MKKLFLIATIICTMALTACGSDAATTEYGTDNNATESTVESTVEDTTEYVEDVVEDTTEETVVEETTEVVEEIPDHDCHNAEPVDWTGYGEGQISIMYIDGTVYEGIIDKDAPDVCVYTILNDEQNYECEDVTIGLKSYGDLFTFDSAVKASELDMSIHETNGDPNWFYRTDVWNSDKVHVGIEFEEDILSVYFIRTIEDNNAYVINGMEFKTVQDFVDVFGKPYGIFYAYNGNDDATMGNENRYYMYTYKVDDCLLYVAFEMSNGNPGECEITQVTLTNPEYSGTMEEIYYISE